MRIDFAELKARIPIEDVAKALQLDLKESNGEIHQYRSPCPACKAGGDRALAITPGRGYYCNASKHGGSSIDLASHIQGVSVRQAAEWLVAHFQSAPPPQAPTPKKEEPAPAPVVAEADPDTLQPLKNLDPAHEAVKTLKLPEEVAIALGAGYCPKGLLAKLVAIPLRTPTGKLLGYIGVKDGKLPSKWRL